MEKSHPGLGGLAQATTHLPQSQTPLTRTSVGTPRWVIYLAIAAFCIAFWGGAAWLVLSLV